MTGFTVFRVRGIPIEIHPSAVLLLAIVFQGVMGRFARPELETLTLLAMAAACALLFFVSILLHELGHSLWALHKRLEVDRITLYGLGGIAWVRSGGRHVSPWTDFQVIAAGPLVTVALILCFGATERAGEALGWSMPVLDVVGYLTWINIILLLFNLAPAFPLDGGQMLRAWLWHRSGDSEAATRTMLRAGAVTGYLAFGGAIVLLATGNLRAGFIFALAGAQILFLVSRFSRIAEPGADRRRTAVVGDLVQRGPVVAPEGISVTEFLDRAARAPGHSTHAFGVTRDGELVGYMSLGLALHVPEAQRDGSTVADAMVRRDAAIQLDPDTPLEQALEQLPNVGDRGIVVDGDRVTGIVLRSAIAEALLEAADAGRGRSEFAEVPW